VNPNEIVPAKIQCQSCVELLPFLRERIGQSKEAMKNFKAALAEVVKVPKSVVERNRKRVKAKSKKKRKS
jgi:hypothetical protein